MSHLSLGMGRPGNMKTQTADRSLLLRFVHSAPTWPLFSDLHVQVARPLHQVGSHGLSTPPQSPHKHPSTSLKSFPRLTCDTQGCRPDCHLYIVCWLRAVALFFFPQLIHSAPASPVGISNESPIGLYIHSRFPFGQLHGQTARALGLGPRAHVPLRKHRPPRNGNQAAFRFSPTTRSCDSLLIFPLSAGYCKSSKRIVQPHAKACSASPPDM